jgi:hypothetical protein
MLVGAVDQGVALDDRQDGGTLHLRESAAESGGDTDDHDFLVSAMIARVERIER